MLGLDAGVDAVLLDGLADLAVGDLIQLGAGDGLAGVGDDAQLLGDGHGGVLVVAGDHDGADAGLTAFHDGGLDLGTDRVDHAGQAQEAEILLQIGGLVPGGLFGPVPLGGGQHAEGLVGHLLVGLQDLFPLGVGHGQNLALFEIAGAALEDFIGGALGVLDIGAARSVDGAHHLAGGIEGRLVHPGLGGGQLTLGKALLGRKVHQGGLGGLALGLTLVVQVGVVAQGHGSGQGGSLAQMLDHRHLVLGQGAGLIGTDDLGAAQGFHGGQTADDGVALAHVGDADGQHHRDHGGQTFRDGRHSQRHRHHEGGQDRIQGEGAGHNQVKDKDEQADAQDQLGQNAAQLFQLALEGSLFLLGVGQGAGNFAHLGVHAGAGDQGLAAAIDHGGAHIAHVFAVAQRNVLLALGQAQGVDDLVDRDALAGEGCLLNLEAGALQQAAVGGNGVAGLQQDHVAGHQLVAVERNLFAVPQYLAGGGGHGLQGLNGGFGLALLKDAQHGVQQHHDQDDKDFCKALLCDEVGHGRDGGCNDEDDEHGIFQLFDEPLKQGGLLSILEFVGAILFEPGSGLRAAQTVRAGLQLVDQLLRGLYILLFHSGCLLLTFAWGESFRGAAQREPYSPEPRKVAKKQKTHALDPFPVHESHSNQSCPNSFTDELS